MVDTMLIEILETMKRGQARSLDELAGILEQDVQTLKVHMEYLEMNGYIRRVNLNTACTGKCAVCTGCSGRAVNFAAWELT